MVKLFHKFCVGAFLIQILTLLCIEGHKTEHLDHPAHSIGDKNILEICKNPYEYVCGDFDQKSKVGNDGFFSKYHGLKEEADKQVIDILGSSSDDSSLPVLNQARYLYKSCIDMKSRNENKSAVLLEHLSSLKGISYKNDPTKWMIKAFPTHPFYQIQLDIGVGPQFLDFIKIFNISIIQSPSMFEKLDTPYLEVYKAFMEKVLKTLIADDKTNKVFPKLKPAYVKTEVERRIKNVMTIETLLERHRINYTVDDNLTLGTVTVGDIKWLELFKVSYPDVKVITVKDKKVNVNLTSSTRRLIYYLEEQELSDYLEWKVIADYVKHLDERYISHYQNTLGLVTVYPITGLPVEPLSTTENCKEITLEFLPHLVDRLYVNKLENNGDLQEIKNDVKKLFSKLRMKLLENIKSSNVLVGKVKDEAISLVENVTPTMGHFDIILENEKLNQMYESYDLTPKMSYLEMFFRLKILHYKNEQRFLRMQGGYYLHSFQIGAHYMYALNIIQLRANLFHPPLYSLHWHLSLNMGGLVWLMAHEISHAIDSITQIISRNQKTIETLHASDLKKSKENMEKNRQCFVEVYGNTKEQGERTANENIADYVGLQLAYEVAEESFGPLWKSTERPKTDKKIPGLETFTNEQLMLINVLHGKSWLYKSNIRFELGAWWGNSAKSKEGLAEVCRGPFRLVPTSVATPPLRMLGGASGGARRVPE
ncbi:peptidase family m13 domain-containing protein [Ditylenchus destructor]|uniref:Peptidase family m13 domain-containing protein n=1 Tax=Ditylenchus destructor TaxID=166010 RepID=A0AAD4QU22_9BILA|nr:peptidase family m13 domain-containing protein [Ditylenchus destructor]